MGRLIDADKLKNDLNKRCATDCNVCSHYRLAQEESRLFGYCGLIDEQPTAYDVDKVVESIKERMDYCIGAKKYGGVNGEEYDTRMLYEIANDVEDIIDIVKGG